MTDWSELVVRRQAMQSDRYTFEGVARGEPDAPGVDPWFRYDGTADHEKLLNLHIAAGSWAARAIPSDQIMARVEWLAARFEETGIGW